MIAGWDAKLTQALQMNSTSPSVDLSMMKREEETMQVQHRFNQDGSQDVSSGQVDDECEQALDQQAEVWGKLIRSLLVQVAEKRWPRRLVFGLVPRKAYRLRQRRVARTIMWWIEYDFPPYNRYRCAAYLAVMRVNSQRQPFVILRSGKSARVIHRLSENVLKETLILIGQEPPMVITRDMGPAWDA